MKLSEYITKRLEEISDELQKPENKNELKRWYYLGARKELYKLIQNLDHKEIDKL